MKLIMTGGGDSEHFFEIDAHFMSLLPEKASLLFIPLAGEPEDHEDGLERIQEVFSTVEFDYIDTCTDFSDLDWEFLSRFDAIYIDGGNTFRLMSEVRQTHFYELIHKFLHQGGVVNGDSAGAIILGSHLETAHFGDAADDNESDLISYQGLNLMGNWTVHCHYRPEDDDEVVQFSQEYGFPVIALPEETAVYIDRRMAHVIGEGAATFFCNGNIHIVEPGGFFDLSLYY